MAGPIHEKFWAKLDGERWHPFLDHCADVAACAEALLAQPLIRRRLARLAQLEDLTEIQVARLLVIAALHDVGKPNHGFQHKATPGVRPVAGHVGEAIALLSPEYALSKRFAKLVLAPMQGWAREPDTVGDLLAASISHHGKPVPRNQAPKNELWGDAFGRSPFAELARLMERVRSWFPRAFEPGGEPLPDAPELQHGFSGLVTLADWLGSSRSAFPYSVDDSDRMPFARERAQRLLREMGIDAGAHRESLGSAPIRFSRLSTHPPRPLQTAVLDAPASPGPSLMLLEAETGAGKTEAALARYLKLFQAGEVDGLYFALPTRTAATQIHRRICEAVERAFPQASCRPPVNLAVPGYLRVDDREGTKLENFEVLWNDDSRERYRFRGWAAEHPKRYLAGEVVVGTIDQVLLSTLRVGHAHLRATSLLRHLLVVDEVHASDTYMTQILGAVLARHRLAGGHALLMSATLGAGARAALLGGKKSAPIPSHADSSAAPYPALTLHGGQPVKIESEGPDKQVAVEIRPWIDAPDSIATRALEAARRGAKVLVIRNTVGACIATQQAMEQLARGADGALLFRCGEVLAPHHARYARDDRTKLDRALEAELGKDAPAGGRVVVATQTVQQSLDLDADLMLTDLCPMDVLLQRVGRLFRHQRARPAGFERARVVVLAPEERDLGKRIGRDGQGRGRHGLGLVYDDLRIMEATWAALEARPLIQIPLQNRELVEAATHPEALRAVVDRLGEPWAAHANKLAARRMAHRGQANLNLVDWSEPFGEHDFGRGEDEQIKTRLGEGDRLLDLGGTFRSPFGASLSTLVMGAWMARDVPPEVEASDVRQEPGGVRFSLGAKRFVYDRLGLRPEPTVQPGTPS